MLVNAVANLTKVLQMKREHSAYVTYLNNIHCGYFSLSYICQPPEFYENVKTNASESLQTSYDSYKRLTNALPTIRMACDWLQICCELLQICCELLQICCEYAFFANFRSMLLI